jgi:hypothetical protein
MEDHEARRSLSGERPMRRLSETKRIISELGMRYEPSAKADLGGHAGKLALLVRDVEDLDPGVLQIAVDSWIKRNPFMPRASDLRGLVEDITRMQGGAGMSDAKRKQIILDECNANLRKWGRLDQEWYRDANGDLKLRAKFDARKRPEWYDDQD